MPAKPLFCIVSAEFPPRPGGVADHTLRLAQELSVHGQVTVLASVGASPRDGIRVFAEVANWHDEVELMLAVGRHAQDAIVIWQYVPHAYGRGGVNRVIPRVMAAVRGICVAQFVIAHEIAAAWSAWPHRSWYAWRHRCQWRDILRSMDAVGISTEAWLPAWQPPGKDATDRVRLLPSPSNFPVVPVPHDHAAAWRRTHDLPSDCRIIGSFGSAVGSALLAWVDDACRACASRPGPTVVLVAWGPTPPKSVNLGRGYRYRHLGFLDNGAASRALHAIDLLALPFTDGVSERRTTFMAGMAHGNAILTTVGINTGKTLRGLDVFQATSVANRDAYAPAAVDLLLAPDLRSKLGARARAAYGTSYDWPVVTRQILEWVAKTSVQE